MKSLWKRWTSLPLAARILIGMVLGLVAGSALHWVDEPMPVDDPSILRRAVLAVDGFSPREVAEIDADRDGTLAPGEWAPWLEARRDLRPDADGDGTVSTDELIAWQAAAPLASAQLDRAAGVFGRALDGQAAADADGDGRLSRRELQDWRDRLEPADRELLLAIDRAIIEVSGGRGKRIANWIAIIGDLFLGLIRSVVVPLVFIAVLAGIAANDDVATVRRIGGGIIVYFLFTTLVAVTIGSVLAVTLRPGEGMPEDFRERGMATAAEVAGERGIDEGSVGGADMSVRERVQAYIPTNVFGSLAAANTLSIVLFAALFGSVLLLLRSHDDDAYQVMANRMVGWFAFLMEICMTVVRWAMLMAPYGVFALMLDITTHTGLQVLSQLGMYAGTVIAGLLGLLVFYGAMVTLVARRSPIEFFRAVGELQILAFSTSSSAAVMPRSIVTAEEKLGVHRSVSRFTIPLGTTINMDGTALYQAVGAIFLMQVFGVDVTFGAVSTILVAAILASVGTPGLPGVGIFVLAGILQSNGVPAAGIALIIGVDRILDMCRTTINVTGDQCACLVMERLAGARIRAAAPAGEGGGA